MVCYKYKKPRAGKKLKKKTFVDESDSSKIIDVKGFKNKKIIRRKDKYF